MRTPGTRIRYTYDLLIQCRDRDRCIISSFPEKLSRDSRIIGICSCGQEFNKTFRNAYEQGGMFCIQCTEDNRVIKKGPKYDYNRLMLCAERDNASVDKSLYTPLTKLNAHTFITGVCSCGQNLTKKFQLIYEGGGMFCIECTEHNRCKDRISPTYHYDLLMKCANEDRAIIDQTIYTPQTKLGSRTIINGLCSCGQEFSKYFEIINKEAGMFCIECTKRNAVLKREEYCLKHFNVKSTSQLPSFKENRENTCLERYKVKHALQVPEFKEKQENTCLERFKTKYPMQVPEIAEKSFKSSHKIKHFSMPSGTIINIQGYEPYALEILLQTYDEDDIVTGSTNVPEIWYMHENEQKRHFVDIYLKSTNTCIEVKSTWTYEKEKEKVLAKQQGSKELGFNYEIWIISQKGDIIEKIL